MAQSMDTCFYDILPRHLFIKQIQKLEGVVRIYSTPFPLLKK